jgi:hypothetical protein
VGYFHPGSQARSVKIVSINRPENVSRFTVMLKLVQGKAQTALGQFQHVCAKLQAIVLSVELHLDLQPQRGKDQMQSHGQIFRASGSNNEYEPKNYIVQLKTMTNRLSRMSK